MRAGVLIPYRGDSTLFIDPRLPLLVSTRRADCPRSFRSACAAWWLTSPSSFGVQAFDAKGRLVYRFRRRPAAASPEERAQFPRDRIRRSSSGWISRRASSTLGAIRTPSSRCSCAGAISAGPTSPGCSIVAGHHDWAVHGTVAFVRGRDYGSVPTPSGRGLVSQAAVRLAPLTDETRTDSRLSEEHPAPLGDDVVRRIDDSLGQHVQPIVSAASPFPAGSIYDRLLKEWKLPAGTTFGFTLFNAPGVQP